MPTQKFPEKYHLALEQAAKEKPQGGLNGFEQEWNLLDEELRPLLTVGAGPSQQSFVDYLRAECIAPWQAQFSQLEVFHWMIEWATRPYYSPRGTIYEARLMEASLINSLHRAGSNFGERLHYWHGNLLFLTDISVGRRARMFHPMKDEDVDVTFLANRNGICVRLVCVRDPFAVHHAHDLLRRVDF